MIKFIDLLRESLYSNKEYKIELKSGKSITKYLNDTDYNNLVANMNSSKGTVKSIELTGKKIDIEPEKKDTVVQQQNGDKENIIDNIKNGNLRGLPVLSSKNIMDIIIAEEIKDKNPRSIIHYGVINGQISAAKVNPEDIVDYLNSKKSQDQYILPSEKNLFINAKKRSQNDLDINQDVSDDIYDTIENKKSKLSSSDSEIKTYLRYWESKHCVYKDDILYDTITDMLRTKINPFK